MWSQSLKCIMCPQRSSSYDTEVQFPVEAQNLFGSVIVTNSSHCYIWNTNLKESQIKQSKLVKTSERLCSSIAYPWIINGFYSLGLEFNCTVKIVWSWRVLTICLRKYLLFIEIHQKTDNHIGSNGVFPKWNGNSVNSATSGNLINHWSMNLGQFQDPVCFLCLVNIVVASWNLLHGRLQVWIFFLV